MRERIAVALESTRARSLGLLDRLSDELQVKQHSVLMSPLVWDLAHVGNYEDQWVLRTVGGGKGVGPQYDEMYNAFKHPRRDRPRLALLSPDESRAYIGRVRGRVMEILESCDIDSPDPLLDSGFVFGLVVQHEQQHDETMLATLQLMSEGYRPDAPPPPLGDTTGLPDEVRVEGGEFTMGTSTEPWAYDNERPAHSVQVDAFCIDTAPVTNRSFADFIDDGGYVDSRHWSRQGWIHRQEAGIEHPLFWKREGSGWRQNRFGFTEEINPNQPVQHVCWYEAEAWCNWAGRRLPTEAEWEFAASWTPDGRKVRYPWGDSPPAGQANLGQAHFSPAEVGSYPEGTSPWGCVQMIGDVWEWTASDFVPYPGFRSFPYNEYSEVFFGNEYKVLRGGSWATDPMVIRNTFRNWDYPIRRQIFSGFRSARDA